MTAVGVSYLLTVNTVTFLLFGMDKKKAQKNQWRVSERTLLLFSMLGGSVGAWLAMHIFRHKTRKFKFAVGIPMIFILQIFICKLGTGF